MFDLSELDTSAQSEQGVLMELRNPSTDEIILSDGQPVSIRLAGIDSKIFREIDREQSNRRFKRMGRKGTLDMTGEEVDRERLERLVACTLGWENVYVDGQRLSFSQEAAHQLYVRFAWIREQADRFLNDRANFLMASRKS